VKERIFAKAGGVGEFLDTVKAVDREMKSKEKQGC
jgi:hypothetical protein